MRGQRNAGTVQRPQSAACRRGRDSAHPCAAPENRRTGSSSRFRGRRRCFSFLALPGHPDLDVVGLLCRKPHVAGAQRHHAVMQIKLAQHFLGACVIHKHVQAVAEYMFVGQLRRVVVSVTVLGM